jgi:hypothetical protein
MAGDKRKAFAQVSANDEASMLDKRSVIPGCAAATK